MARQGESTLKIIKISEEWRPVVGYEGRYEVSNYGEVKSLIYKGNLRDKILKSHYDKDGYLITSLGRSKTVKIHRLVAEAFISNPENKPCVDHINKIRNDNRAENLQWATISENNTKGYKQGRVIPEHQKQAIRESKQIISTFINEKLNQEFTGNPYDLVRVFPEQKLNQGALNSVRNRRLKQHKGWTIKF
jgi:hypothetical protein